jgi:hypothetical protein
MRLAEATEIPEANWQKEEQKAEVNEPEGSISALWQQEIHK